MATQSVFTFSCKKVPGSTVAAFHGVEGVSKCYRFEIDLAMAHDEEFDMTAAIGAKARLHGDRSIGGEPFSWGGVISTMELLNEFKGYAYYRAVLVPRLWQLTLSRHSRVFVNQSIPEILEEVLRKSGITDFEMKLNGTYRPLDHVCQYQESNLAFLQRRMEFEGMYFFFDQTDDGEKLVITDAASFSRDMPAAPVRYFAQGGGDHAHDQSITTWTCKTSQLPEKIDMRDYDYLNPNLVVAGHHPIANGPGAIVYHHENFLTPGEGERLALVRAQEYLARETVFHGWGNQMHFRPGFVFELEENPRPSFNQRYFVTDCHHFANQSAHGVDVKKILKPQFDDVYRVEVTAIPASTQFRPERLTHWPRIYSIVSGVIDAAEGDPYAEIDKHGRYHVKVHFDETPMRQAKASMWVRMLQPHGGNPEGFHFPLRKDTEVLLIFLGGDPDRPIIAGVAPNALTPSPVTSANASMNVIQTGGENRVEMEDTAGSQYVAISSPPEKTFLHMGQTHGGGSHNFTLKTNGTGLVYTGSTLDVEVEADKNEHVVSNVTENYDANQTTTVLANQTSTVLGSVAETYTGTHDNHVIADVAYLYDANETKNVAANVTHTYGGNHDITVSGNRTDTVNGTLDKTVLGAVNVHYAASHAQKVDGDHSWHIQGSKNEMTIGVTNSGFIGIKNTMFVGGQFNLTIAEKNDINIGVFNKLTISSELGLTAGAHTNLFCGMKTSLTAAVDLSVFVGAKIDITAAVKMNLEASLKLEMAASLKVTLTPLDMRTVGILIVV